MLVHSSFLKSCVTCTHTHTYRSIGSDTLSFPDVNGVEVVR